MRSSPRMTLWMLVAGVSFAAGATVGEEGPGAVVAGSEAAPVPMALNAVTIDGVLDEACWTAVEPVRAWVPKSEASDHLPVVAEFKWR